MAAGEFSSILTMAQMRLSHSWVEFGRFGTRKQQCKVVFLARFS